MVSLFLDNHDVPRFMQDAGELADDERVRRYRLALVALFTLPGIPQLYYGDELGMLGAYPENRRDLPAWAFDPATRAGARAGYLGDPAQTFAFTRTLIMLRNAHPALWQGYFAELWRPNGGKNLYAYFRAAAGDRVLVIIDNGTGPSGDIDLGFATHGGIAAQDRAGWPDGTVLHDVLGTGAPATVTVAAGKIRVNMPAKTAGVYFAE
jgi:glycosidase